MDRTLRAALLAALLAFAAVAGIGVFLGFEPTGAVVTGLVLAVLAGLLIWGAARRADSFHPTEEIPPVEPGFPGPPPHRDEDEPDEAERPPDAGTDDPGSGRP